MSQEISSPMNVTFEDQIIMDRHTSDIHDILRDEQESGKCLCDACNDSVRDYAVYSGDHSGLYFGYAITILNPNSLTSAGKGTPVSWVFDAHIQRVPQSGKEDK